MLTPAFKKNDAKAKWLIGIFSVIVFAVVVILGKYNFAGQLQLGFDVHLFALGSATINGLVAIFLLAGLITIKQKKYALHKNIMMSAMILSVLFLLCYIAHHLFAGETPYKGEGIMRTIYFLVLFTHIPLAGIGLPFILFSAYRALTGEYEQHKKMVRYVWPLWFYVAVTGVVVYIMIAPYYQ
jgi:putative membrane protein